MPLVAEPSPECKESPECAPSILMRSGIWGAIIDVLLIVIYGFSTTLYSASNSSEGGYWYVGVSVLGAFEGVRYGSFSLVDWFVKICAVSSTFTSMASLVP